MKAILSDPVEMVLFALFVWSLALCAHLMWEAWIIASRGLDALPECRRVWCPHGIRNRWRS